jgi:8-oxo-dGTP diphosphatase
MLIVTCALIEQEGKVLIAQRSEKMHLPFHWEFPGGKQEIGESLQTCIRREILEELLIEIKLKGRLSACVHSYPEKEITLIPFLATIEKGTPTLTEHINLAYVDESTIGDFVLAPADQKVWKMYLSRT